MSTNPYNFAFSDEEGLTKREHFAVLILAATITNEGTPGKLSDYRTPADESIRKQDARRSCLQADALIEALNEKRDAD